jgi:hypothetical protein
MNKKIIKAAKVIEAIGLAIFYVSLLLILVYALDKKLSFSFDVSEDLIIYPLFSGLLLILVSAIWLRSKSALRGLIEIFTNFS